MEADDTTLVRRCLHGDRDAFAGLVARYEKPVYRVSLRMLGNPEDAGDATQAVFVRAFQRLGAYDPKYKFFSWIYRIAIHEAFDLLERRRRLELRERVDEPPDGDERTPETWAAAGEARQALQSALMTLTPEHRMVIVLRHFLDLSYREIADIVGIAEKTVKSRLFSARHALRERLAGQGVTRP